MSAHDGVYAALPPEPEKATLAGRNKILGFWFYIAGESVIFGSLFVTYIALRNSTNGGPSPAELFSLPMVALTTLILLTSSMTSVLAILAMHRQNLRAMRGWFFMTMLLGMAFIALEIYEFVEYYHHGHTLTSSAFGSAFYTLVGFHGGHVLFGLCWLLVLLPQSFQKGLTVVTAPKFYVFSIYWHFVDLVWVFIFTVVYLMGMVG